MSDYIKRSDAINLLWYFQDECCSAVVGDVEKLPSANRPQGEWISVCGNKQCNCSVCGEGFDHTYEWIERWNFCPNCGARMKGADDGVDDV